MTTGTGSSKPVLIGSGDEQRLASDAPFEQPQRDFKALQHKPKERLLHLVIRNLQVYETGSLLGMRRSSDGRPLSPAAA
ncbi:hypothetical protein WJX75_005090 [Coccomyxa subellipsoidea]|uniref:Uncharacterized protein n=1 Tax=Coccomyxa subellipsoidea TaxID=248742 RepID=A0ABR2YNS9_9CHLO